MSGRQNRRRGEQVAAIVSLLGQALGLDSKQKRKKPVQCFRCQKLGHFAADCTGRLACSKCAKSHLTRDCTKPREAAATCCNCGGSHAVNHRGCSYLKSCRRGKERHIHRRRITAQEEVTRNQDALSAHRATGTSAGAGASGGPRCCNPYSIHKIDDAVANAVAALKSAMAAESAAPQAEVDEVRLQLAQLRELLASKSRKGRDVTTATIATQTDALPAHAVTQYAVGTPMDVANEMIAPSSKEEDRRKQDSEPAPPAMRDDVTKGIETSARPSEDKAGLPLLGDEVTTAAPIQEQDTEDGVHTPPAETEITAPELLKMVAKSLRNKTFAHLNTPYLLPPPMFLNHLYPISLMISAGQLQI
ncbi:uncharacterized protein LOC126267938 [Schistocerca gregaria]|uniref:uncharacterized protein LOC126267938 n=1 Tax=Schistocerca gregaria TaxID=7010 RepID=UPI00211EE769|nr:uncharacterized protein LOC126267938 [Schistocerca gregaria]